MTDPKPPTLAQALITATLAQEAAVLAVLQTTLDGVAPPLTPLRTDQQQEQDYDNLPV